MATNTGMEFDYRPLVEARGSLGHMGHTLRVGAYADGVSAVTALNHGIAAEACDIAAEAIFRALNALAHMINDSEAMRVLHNLTWTSAEEDERCA